MHFFYRQFKTVTSCLPYKLKKKKERMSLHLTSTSYTLVEITPFWRGALLSRAKESRPTLLLCTVALKSSVLFLFYGTFYRRHFLLVLNYRPALYTYVRLCLSVSYCHTVRCLPHKTKYHQIKIADQFDNIFIVLDYLVTL